MTTWVVDSHVGPENCCQDLFLALTRSCTIHSGRCLRMNSTRRTSSFASSSVFDRAITVYPGVNIVLHTAQANTSQVTPNCRALSRMLSLLQRIESSALRCSVQSLNRIATPASVPASSLFSIRAQRWMNDTQSAAQVSSSASRRMCNFSASVYFFFAILTTPIPFQHPRRQNLVELLSENEV